MNDKQFEALLDSINALSDNVAELHMTLYAMYDRLFLSQPSGYDDDEKDEDEDNE